MDKIGLPQIGMCGDGAMKALKDLTDKVQVVKWVTYASDLPQDADGLYKLEFSRHIPSELQDSDLLYVLVYSKDNVLYDGEKNELQTLSDYLPPYYSIFTSKDTIYFKKGTQVCTVWVDANLTDPSLQDLGIALFMGGDWLVDYGYYLGAFVPALGNGENFDELMPFLTNTRDIAKWANAKFAQLADTDALKERLDNLIKDAPEAYNTLKEIGDYIATHKSEYEALNALANKKVDKEAGKGLSSNDYTTAEKAKLASVQEGATKTVVDAEISEDSTNPVQGKAIAELQKQLTQALREIGSMARDLYSHDTKELPLLCGQPSILFAHGTPQEAVVPVNWKQYDWTTDTGYDWNGQPSALGQQYINIDATTGGRYIAVPNDNGSLSWKNF